ncbi:hypothetical protein NEUTE1DRAFT_34901 [Neurospora tetrasperma FGSC 2508]|uniref:Uncharacterized protein n=1 Tax=Neurospora tetrasperma (strain FGSC 2508 / ATCC MYA-4615 / P0657) TaxID=510951 RepID=F8MF15_NEUT8|nr:uncharacterized protein NEUTE1DRAFT_34901 [Neurospora tetrasperma FGSC 2508]EGO60067.1 hypothetical protein NEUTE1DRAFT_34901 [Neurospora tetrasperma FGSC 2508]EGZ75982.1 hypothetical protein NEUTE2DRAFT_58761 [Neurospora tetrasperma FGSC 2509]
MNSTSSRTASPAPPSPPANPRLQINTSIQTDDANTESATSSFQRSSAPSPSPTLSSPPQPLPSNPTASQLEPTPSIYSPRPDPLPNSADATRSTSPVGVGPTRPNSPARLVNEDEPFVPEVPSSPVLAHSVPVPVPVGARVDVPGLVQDVDTEPEPGQSCETTTITIPPTAGATDITLEEEDLSARLSTSLDTDLDTGIATSTYKLTPSLIPDVLSTSTRKSPQKEPESAVVMEGKGNEGVEDERMDSHLEVKVNGSRTALLELEEVLSSEKGNLRGKVEMSEARVMKVQGQDTRPSHH